MAGWQIHPGSRAIGLKKDSEGPLKSGTVRRADFEAPPGSRVCACCEAAAEPIGPADECLCVSK
jgi:hypothetical protein